jgi:nucleotide-binding universal stress UspA family protein
MFERILVPVDGSLRAELILSQVGRILKREDSEILLLRVVDVPLAIGRLDLASLRREEFGRAQNYVHDLALRFSEKAAKVHGRVAEGPAAQVILDTARTEGSTLIAMSTHGGSGLARWLMGSVAEKVVRSSEVPVLLVRSFRSRPGGDLQPATAEEIPFRKILVPTDGSPASMAVVATAGKFAQLYDSEVVVLHVETPPIVAGTEMGVLPPPIPTPSQEDPVTAPALDRFRQAGLRATALTTLGDPAGEIVDQSYAAGIDLIAMATHGRSGLSRWVLGSVAERVLRHAGTPLLLVRGEPARKRDRKTVGKVTTALGT